MIEDHQTIRLFVASGWINIAFTTLNIAVLAPMA